MQIPLWDLDRIAELFISSYDELPDEIAALVPLRAWRGGPASPCPCQASPVVEVGLIDDLLKAVGLGEPSDDLVDLVADLLVALQGHHVVERAAGGNVDQALGIGLLLVRDVLDERQRQDVVLVLRGRPSRRAARRNSSRASRRDQTSLMPFVLPMLGAQSSDLPRAIRSLKQHVRGGSFVGRGG